MRLFVPASVCALLGAPVIFAQSVVTTYRADTVNGGYIASASSASTDHTQTQTSQSINATEVPLEQRQERVIRSDANESLTETIIRRYDPTGQFASTERVVTETKKGPNGATTTESKTYRSDINGGEQLAEHRVAETRVSGDTSTTDTTVERPGPDGALQPAETRQAVKVGTDAKSTTTETVYRAGSYDSLREAERKVVVQTKAGNKTVVDTTDYQPGYETGALQFQERRVETSVTAADGAQATTVDVYAPSADGHARDADSPPQLNQQQIITRTKAADGSLVETFSVREPNITDASQLGPPREISKTVCTGNCGPSANPAPGTALPGSAAGAGAQSKP